MKKMEPLIVHTPGLKIIGSAVVAVVAGRAQK